MTYLAVVFGILLSINLWGVYDCWKSGLKVVSFMVLLATVAELFGVLGYFHALHMLGAVLTTIVTLLSAASWTHRESDRYEQGLSVHWTTRWILS